MKKIILVLIVLLFSNNAYTADWKLVMTMDNISVYHDISSAEPFEGGVIVWTKFEFSPPKIAENGIKIKQFLKQTAYICNTNAPQYALYRLIFYNNNDEIISDESLNNEFKPLPNNISDLAQINTACSLTK